MLRTRRDGARPLAPLARALVADEDAPLLSALKAKRRALAEAQGVPAYIVFTDRTLVEMAAKRPATLDAMAGISGVGAAKLDRYGRRVPGGDPRRRRRPSSIRRGGGWRGSRGPGSTTG